MSARISTTYRSILLIKAQAVREMGHDFRDIDMTEASDLCYERAAAIEAEATP